MGYKVLLVDDEAWVVESLKASVDWKAHGFEVAGTALSGSEALSLMSSLKPDVVFTDIRMPGMNGLELIKRGSELPHRAHYIVVSGYAEFAYAQKALTYGALAYCLKPFDEGEIISILGKFKREKEGARLGSSGALQAYLEDPGTLHRELLLNELTQEEQHDGIEEGFGVIICAMTNASNIPMPGKAVQVKIAKGKHLLLTPWSQVENIIQAVWQEHEGKIKGIGVSERLTDLEKLSETVSSVSVLSDQSFIRGEPGVFSPSTPNREVFNETLKHLGDSIRDGDVAGANRAFDRVTVLFREGGLTVRHALHLYNIVHSFMYRFKAESSDNMLYSHELLFSAYPSFAEMLQYLRQFVSRHILEAPEFGSQESSNETFRTILQYVNQNYLQDLSIQSLSQKFYTNPSYISQLFKKETGETFTAYIAKLRITYACELLSGTSQMVGEIAEKAGYPDYFYFTKIFKRMIGKTPSQFRAEMKG